MVLPSAGYVRVTIPYHGSAVPQGAATVLTFADVDVDSSFESLRDLLEPLWNDVIDSMDSGVQVTEALFKRGPDSTGPSAILPLVAGGINTGTNSAPQRALLVQKATAVGGRAGRGRMYLPGLRDADVNEGGQLATAVREQFQEDVDDFLEGMSSGNWPLVLEHQAGSPLEVPTVVTSLNVQSQVATIRKRNRR